MNTPRLQAPLMPNQRETFILLLNFCPKRGITLLAYINILLQIVPGLFVYGIYLGTAIFT
jgi:hypothetical protein